MSTVYRINKNINKPIEFKGLKAQYIWYLAGGIILMMVLFAVLYISGLNSYVCVALISMAGILLFSYVYKLSNKYGEHGLMKKIARRSVPKIIKSRNREFFYEKQHKGQVREKP